MDETCSTPQPFMKGVFALYHTPDGGIHLAFRTEGSDTDEHVQCPPMLAQLIAETQRTGRMPSPMALLKLARA